MMNRKKLIYHYFFYLIISLSFTILLSILNHSLFIEGIIDSKYFDLFESRNIPMPYGENKEIEINVDVEWPVKSLLFFYFISSVYWYSFGFYLKKKFKNHSVGLLFSIPLVIGIVNFDILYILLFILSILGYCLTSLPFHKK